MDEYQSTRDQSDCERGEKERERHESLWAPNLLACPPPYRPSSSWCGPSLGIPFVGVRHHTSTSLSSFSGLVKVHQSKDSSHFPVSLACVRSRRPADPSLCEDRIQILKI